ncbi:hypothetical protein HDU81_009098 [Chytriomyces hyalinus]|nr:hypothetical protein HDU81_009098 [Chytriomyces hyalinus]
MPVLATPPTIYSSTPMNTVQAEPSNSAASKKPGPPPKNATAADGSGPATPPVGWTALQVEALLRHRYETFRSDFLDEKNKEIHTTGWKRVCAALNMDLVVKYTVEQCKSKVVALESLWGELQVEERGTVNSERKKKMPDCFESIALYFANKSGLNGETPAYIEDGAIIPQVDALASSQSFAANPLISSSSARSSSSTVSLSGSVANIDSNKPEDELDGDISEAGGAETLSDSEDSCSETDLSPDEEHDIAVAFENFGNCVGAGLSELANAITGAVSGIDSNLSSKAAPVKCCSISQSL